MAELAGIQRFKATDGWVRQFQHRFPQLKRYKVQVRRGDPEGEVCRESFGEDYVAVACVLS